MSAQFWVKIFNNSSVGSNKRKSVLRMISDERAMLFIDGIGFIYHNTLAKKQFSYGVGSKQLIIKDEDGKVHQKISFGLIEKMETMNNETSEYIKLIVRN